MNETIDDSATLDLLTAMAAANAAIRVNGLRTSVVEFSPGSSGAHRWNPDTQDWTKPVFPEISLIMYARPMEFLRWAEYLSPDRISVHRRDMDTCMHLSVDRDGLTWRAHSGVTRPKSGPHLPGITVDWKRQRSGRRGDHAVITVSELRASLESLGVLEVAS